MFTFFRCRQILFYYSRFKSCRAVGLKFLCFYCCSIFASVLSCDLFLLLILYHVFFFVVLCASFRDDHHYLSVNCSHVLFSCISLICVWKLHFVYYWFPLYGVAASLFQLLPRAIKVSGDDHYIHLVTLMLFWKSCQRPVTQWYITVLVGEHRVFGADRKGFNHDNSCHLEGVLPIHESFVYFVEYFFHIFFFLGTHHGKIVGSWAFILQTTSKISFGKTKNVKKKKNFRGM